jgi:N-acetylglucosamine-6-phosphate deacetylase
MSSQAIVHGRVMTPDQVLEDGTIIIEDQHIAAILPYTYAPAGATCIDAQGLTIAPGFIDVHVHGASGHDVMDATPEAIYGISEFFATHGVTSFLPTTVTAASGDILAAVENITRCQRAYRGGARILGVHLEGPYLSHAYAGAQLPEHIRPPDPAEYPHLFASGNIRLLSLAPEITGSSELIAYALQQGSAIALAHSGASYEVVMNAVELGLSQACHTFNGMSPLHHRNPGTVGAVLSCDAIYAQIIADRQHVHPAVIKLLVKAKGSERTILITDSMRATGMPEGNYEIGGQEVTVSNGRVYLTHGNSLAGSILTMDQALRNIIEITGLSLAEALPMTSQAPAQSLGLAHELGSIRPGYIADLVLLDQHLHVQTTIVQGQVVYQAAT